MRYWHARLNRELFRGKLPKIAFSIHEDRTTYTEFYADGYYWGNAPKRIHINPQPVLNRRMLLSVLAHEMVHQYQDMLGLPLTHGAYFKRQQVRLAKHGLEI